MARKTKAEAEQTRRLLLDTAEKVFSEKGVAHSSLDDIAKAASMTRGAIYWHFANKAELFEAMHSRILLPIDQLRADVVSQADPLRALQDFWVQALITVAEDESVRRVLDIMLNKCEYAGELRKLLQHRICITETLIDLMSHAYAEAARKGLLADGVDPKLAAIATHSFVIGTISNWLLLPDRCALKAQAEPLMGLFMRALRSSASV
jgi:AcrR family transcriptional regulator